ETPQTLRVVNLPTISLNDCFTTKLLANADRWNDSSTNARDLIDLAVLRRQSPIPNVAIAKAEAAYQVQQPLIEAIKRFQASAKLRQKCYDSLRIENRVMIIDGIDLLADDFTLKPTEREFNETDFSYLD
ncbi:MAG: nucleotidyl transferase AbiEii/AbiGii toxin family protein, partial [Pleurocapsa sp. MO_226.B13]|nr:nucleotidyl transferase AbiEii/AbiGii toxin family protein [Pleurocapsa sp. MO_226.B13]